MSARSSRRTYLHATSSDVAAPVAAAARAAVESVTRYCPPARVHTKRARAPRSTPLLPPLSLLSRLSLLLPPLLPLLAPLVASWPLAASSQPWRARSVVSATSTVAPVGERT